MGCYAADDKTGNVQLRTETRVQNGRVAIREEALCGFVFSLYLDSMLRKFEGRVYFL